MNDLWVRAHLDPINMHKSTLTAAAAKIENIGRTYLAHFDEYFTSK